MNSKRHCCIYCRTLGAIDFFSSEHVIPEAFGTFGTDTLTLYDCVCKDCNKYFGNNLELFFNRGSWEAIERFKHGLKPLSELPDIHRHRITFSLASEGKFKGAKVVLVSNPTDTEPLIDLVPQVGFLIKGTNEREFFTLEELVSMNSFSKEKYALGDQANILFCTRGEKDEKCLIDQLNRLGIQFNKIEALPGEILVDPRVMVESNWTFDLIARRTIAKVAFNYMTKQMGSEYALRSDFDRIRAFIRYGEKADYQIVRPSNTPILAFDTSRLRQTEGHLLNLETHNSWLQLVANVSLFNAITYTVILSPLLSGITSQISVGHHFNFINKKVEKLISLPKRIKLF